MDCRSCKHWNTQHQCDKFGEVPMHLVIENPCQDGEALEHHVNVIDRMIPECEKHGLEQVKRYLVAFKALSGLDPWNQDDFDAGIRWLYEDMKDGYERRALIYGIQLEPNIF